MVVDSSIRFPLTTHRSDSPRSMPPPVTPSRSVLARMTLPVMAWVPEPAAFTMTTVPSGASWQMLPAMVKPLH